MSYDVVVRSELNGYRVMDSYNSYHSEILTLHSTHHLISLVINKPYYTRVFNIVYSKHINSSQETCTYVEL